MLAIARFNIVPSDAAIFKAEAEAALAVLGKCLGFIDGQVGRNTDDDHLWVLVTRWINVGSYRRALGVSEVKYAVVPLLSRAIDEPGAYI